MSIDQLLAALAAETGGSVAFAFRDLQTQATSGHRADQPVPTASVIKLPILIHIAMAVAEGQLTWDSQLALSDAVKVGGSGILKELSAGLSMSLRDLCVLMIALSDNTATNMLIDLVGIDAVNQRLDQLGCPQTRLLRRAFSPDTPRSRPFGLGVTTAAEQIDLLTRLVKHQLGGPAVDDTVLAMLAMQQDRAAIPRLLPSGWTYAGKTGSNIGLRADVGLISAPDGRQFVMAVFCSGMPGEDWSVENPGLRAIARLAQALLLA